MPTLLMSQYNIVGVDQSGAAAVPNVSKSLATSIRGITPDGSAPTISTLRQTQVVPMSSQDQLSTEEDDIGAQTFSVDAYRSGAAANGVASTDEISVPRTLGPNGTVRIGQDPDIPGYGIADMTLSVGKEDIISSYSRFFLQSVVEAEQEKYQIVETFSTAYAFFYGKRPVIYRYSGTLLNDENFKWNNDFKFIYENFFRGTSAVGFTDKNNPYVSGNVVIYYDTKFVYGFPLSLTMQQESLNDKSVPFSMDVFVVDSEVHEFSRDVESLIATKRAELESRQAEINARLALINKDTPTAAANYARRALNDKATTDSVSKTTDNVNETDPISNTKNSIQEQRQQAEIPDNLRRETPSSLNLLSGTPADTSLTTNTDLLAAR